MRLNQNSKGAVGSETKIKLHKAEYIDYSCYKCVNCRKKGRKSNNRKATGGL